MRRRIEKAAVLGAGTMGSRIAAHFANAGLPCVLLDMVPQEPGADRNKIVRAGLEAAKKGVTRRESHGWKLRGRPDAVRGGGLDH